MGNGINIFSAVPDALNAVIQGNYIGTNAAGTAAIGNGAQGIGCYASHSVIGGTAGGARNVISGNNGHGIDLALNGANALIQGNYIGTNAAGTAAVPNDGTGVNLATADNLLGGAVPGARNLLSGNGENGVTIIEAGATGNMVQGNSSARM